MSNEPEEDDRIEWCTVTIEGDGTAVARYRFKGAGVDGADRFDDDVTGWSDEEIREHVCAIVGVRDDEADQIQVNYA